MSQAFDLARVRHDNALRLFDEFVQANVKSADAATLRGLERRFAERLQIQPSYWSQIKARSRQIGERLARQFEQLCRKPAGWMDQPHGSPGAAPGAPGTVADGVGAPAALAGAGHPALRSGAAPHAAPPPSQPLDDDERFIVGLVLTYYRRHPQRARARLLDLLGEVLTPGSPHEGDATSATPHAAGNRPAGPPRQAGRGDPPVASAAPAPAADDDLALWQRSQAGVAPLPRKR